MISVIIATINRSDALREISLPSLLRQDSEGFEIIVWDASEDDLSRDVCESEKEKFRDRRIDLRYFHAPRKGLASQRNDAVSAANGSEVYFIDDDCEVSVDAVRSLDNCFRSFPWLMGGGVPMLNKTPSSGSSSLLKLAARMFGMKNSELCRKVTRAGGLSLPIKDLPGPAEWLSGGSMGYRRFVFDEMKFDERLETFGGYALGEDVDFSHRIFLRYKQPLMVTNGGYVIHHSAAGGDRNIGANRVAATIFNRIIIRKNFESLGAKFSKVAIAWAGFGDLLSNIRSAKVSDLRNGRKMAKEALKRAYS